MTSPKTRILVVDDQPHLARIVRLFLEATGLYEVLLETRPHEVPAIAREYRPAAILLDVDMPGKNGAEVARDLWRSSDLSCIPILFFSGLVPATESGLRETPHGRMRFVSKLIPPWQLLAAIEEAIGAAAPGASSAHAAQQPAYEGQYAEDSSLCAVPA